MNDFTLKNHKRGTLVESNTDRAKDWIVDFLPQLGLADPIVDEVGAELIVGALERQGFIVHDARLSVVAH